MRFRSRPIAACAAPLLAGFAVAVQRDTFIRRWLVPPPTPSLLTRNVPAVDFTNTYFLDAVEQISKASGVQIDASDADIFLLKYDLHVRNVTVCRALADLLAQDRQTTIGNVFEERDGVLIVRFVTLRDRSIARVHSITDLLPPAGVGSKSLRAAFLGQNGQWADTRVLAAEEVQTQVQALLPTGTIARGRLLTAPCFRFGDRLIIIAPPGNQTVVQETLDTLQKNGFANWPR